MAYRQLGGTASTGATSVAWQAPLRRLEVPDIYRPADVLFISSYWHHVVGLQIYKCVPVCVRKDVWKVYQEARVIQQCTKSVKHERPQDD